jgi:phosphoglucosamine mutase
MPERPINIFGTDGVRGFANSGVITPDGAIKLAISAVKHFKKGRGDFTVVIGKDTRLSGYMLEPALTSGFIAAGADVRLLGPIPTPAVSVITRTLRADLGVVISASHNPYKDNGIKFFNNRGFKISQEDEEKITEFFFGEMELVGPEKMGKAKRIDDIDGRYVEFVKSSFMRNLTLAGMRIVVDCANGAAYKVAPEVFWELGAEVIAIGDEPDGLNINEGCGATDTRLLQEMVVSHKADIGFAIDGDADRIIVVDERGNVIDGDYVIAVIATDWKNRGKLKGGKVVATTMSNMALEKYLDSKGIELIRSEVGDKYVIERMIEVGSNLGGEKSGHIIPFDYSTTGDSLVSALQVLNFLASNNKKASHIQNLYKPYPQVFKNLNKEVDIHSDHVKNAIFSIENEVLQDGGRLIVRKSGTENVIRIMVESKNEEDIEKALWVIDKAVSQM